MLVPVPTAGSAGDFGNDSGEQRRDDLAVAAEWQQVTAPDEWGAVNFIYGSITGQASDGNQIWNRWALEVGLLASGGGGRVRE